MNEVYIYGLICPLSNEIRYVGKTTQKLNKRLSQYLSATYKSNPHKYNWINQLKLQGLKPTIKIIEICNSVNWVEREKFWINDITNLTNITQGGENGLFFTSEILEKISIGVKNYFKNPIVKELCSINSTLYWNNIENRINHGLKIKGSKRSTEHKEILSNIKESQWKNNDYKESMCKQSKNLWNDSEYKEKTLKYIQSDENKKTVSLRFKDKPLSFEHREKMSTNSKNKKEVIINGILYNSITEASKLIPIERNKLKSRIKSKNFTEYNYKGAN